MNNFSSLNKMICLWVSATSGLRVGAFPLTTDRHTKYTHRYVRIHDAQSIQNNIRKGRKLLDEVLPTSLHANTLILLFLTTASRHTTRASLMWQQPQSRYGIKHYDLFHFWLFLKSLLTVIGRA